MDLIQMLNANSGAIVAVTASVSAIITILLLLEARTTRNLRREAAVLAYPRAHGEAGMYLELVVENGGPANAHDVKMGFCFKGPDGNVAGHPRLQADPVMAPGHSRRFLPSPGQSLPFLNDLADQSLSLVVDWSWADDRRRLWFLPARQARSSTSRAVDLRDGLYGGWALTEPNTPADLHKIAETSAKLEKQMGVIVDQVMRIGKGDRT